MLIKQFKKDYLPYLLGIIIPAGASFLTIPILKNILGPADFGVYTFYLSILLIINSSFSGGVTQSIIRLHVDNDKRTFYYHSLSISFYVSLIICIPLFIYILSSYHLVSFALLFIVSLFLANLYTSLLAVTQSKFLSVTSAISESVRTIVFLLLSITLIHFFKNVAFLVLLFIAICVSYTLVSSFLFFRNKLEIKRFKTNVYDVLSTARQMVRYGGYLVGWFFFSYGISMANRFILAGHFGKESIGHFTASFDIINKSIVFLLSPVLLSLFPLIVKAHTEDRSTEVRHLIKKLTIIEASLMLGSLIAFPFVGFPLLSNILHTPMTADYLWLDMEVIAGSFIWQLAMLQHKYLELHKKTLKMLLFICIAFVISFSADWFCISYGGLQLAGIGFLAGGLVYLLTVMWYSERNLTQKGDFVFESAYGGKEDSGGEI